MVNKAGWWRAHFPLTERARKLRDIRDNVESFEAWCATDKSAPMVVGTAKGNTSVNLCGRTIRELDLQGIGDVTLTDCKIAILVATGANPTYRITGCMIGNFRVIKGFPVQYLKWERGYLGQFSLDKDVKDAFVGDVRFDGLILPRKFEPHRLQWLRDTREALNARSNSVAAGIFHASELALSRWDEPRINKWASYVYHYGSNFGNSLGRPVGWFFGLIAAIFVLALAVGTKPSVEAGSGWQTALNGEGCVAQALRAGVYAMQSVFNPLNLIVPKPLVSVAHWGAALGSFVLGLLGIVAFALFLLSIRRRFKLE